MPIYQLPRFKRSVQRLRDEIHYETDREEGIEYRRLSQLLDELETAVREEMKIGA